jgi:ferrous iron transport protein B
VVKRETNSWRYPVLMAVYLFVLAYVAAWITYRVALIFGAG